MKKVLIITYYWPPCGGVAVQRWLKICKYLSLFECLPTVITTENGDYPFIDESLMQQISPDLKVIRTKTPTFKNIFKTLLGKNESLPYGSLKTSKEDSFIKKLIFFVRSQLVIPDARVIWNKNAFKAAEKAIFGGIYEAVITTGPPHSTHLIGCELKKKYNLTWIADFRDPWTNIYYYQTFKRNFIIRFIDQIFEKRVVQTADRVVTVSEKIAELLPSRKIDIIPNSFDPDDYINYQYSRSSKFRVKFVGSLTSTRKNECLQFIHLLDQIAEENDFDIEFSLIGNQYPISESLDLRKIKLIDTGFIEHQKVIESCVNSELLLLIINQTAHNDGILTYKLFEYLGAKTQILGIGPVNGDASQILQQSKSGQMFDYQDTQGMTSMIKDLYQQWSDGNDIKNQHDLTQYSAPYIASQFSHIILKATH